MLNTVQRILHVKFWDNVLHHTVKYNAITDTYISLITA